MADVGNSIKAKRSDWSFDGDVFKNFDDHVKKSVPLYNEGHDLIINLSDYFLKNDSLIYDIGSSTGSFFDKVSKKVDKQIRMIGIEPAFNMFKFSSDRFKNNKNISFINDDVMNIKFEKSDMIICYYTLQFIPPKNRALLLTRLFDSLNWGGALFLFEKVRASDARFQDILSNAYIEYKLESGFSSEEIFNKQRSLKGVLEPFSSQGNIDNLLRAGFKDIITISKYIQFEGFMAIK
jgi:tRNA (cmo5U34)-methyltransferase